MLSFKRVLQKSNLISNTFKTLMLNPRVPILLKKMFQRKLKEIVKEHKKVL